ncbi:MAG: hypothetical protein FJ125_16215 [Deltaproteobacteria bacterium]|nr:hypothetical protein [Deltaproteobacteria bacterium]
MGELPSVPLDRLGWWMVAWPVEPTGCVRGVLTRQGAAAPDEELTLLGEYGLWLGRSRSGADGSFCSPTHGWDLRLTASSWPAARHHESAGVSFEGGDGGSCAAEQEGCVDLGVLELTPDNPQCVQLQQNGYLPELLALYEQISPEQDLPPTFRGRLLPAESENGSRSCLLLPRWAGDYSAIVEPSICGWQDYFNFSVNEDDGDPAGPAERCNDEECSCQLVELDFFCGS